MSKINRPQMRVLLDHLGVPFHQQGSTMKENTEQLNIFRRSEEERYNKAYDLVINQKLPGDATQKMIQSHELGRLVLEHMSEQETSAISAIRTKSNQRFEELLAELIPTVKQTVKDEAAKYRTVEIKVAGKANTKKIKCVLPKCFDSIAQLGANRINTMLVGPSGCGKTFIAEKVAEALELDFASQSCSEGMSESILTGWLLPIGVGGIFEYVRSEFVRIYEEGGVFLIDEMDASDPNVLVFLNQALANEGFYLPQRHKKPYVKKHKDFVAIAATNTYGNGSDPMYAARNQLDAATLDRFKVGTIAMDYDNHVEETLIREDVLEWGLSVRDKITQHKLRRIMSTRVMLDACTMVNSGWSIKQVSDNYFNDWMPAEMTMIGGNQL